MRKIQDIIGPMRLPFIILTPACVILGLGTAIWAMGSVNASHVILLFLGATSAHISVNAFNEYFDFKSGLDFKTQRTPFSGGSGTLPEKPALARWTLATAIVTFLVTLMLGVYFVAVSGLALLPLGIVGLFLVYAYTPWLTHKAFLCLIAPGLGFGPLMVLGTHFVLTRTYSWSAFVASLIPFFLVSNLLLLNQFPDVDADNSIKRRNYPIIIGRRASSIIYIGFFVFAYLTIIYGVYAQFLPELSLINLITCLLAIPAGIGAYRHADRIDKLIPFMGANVLINLATPVLVAVGLLVSTIIIL